MYNVTYVVPWCIWAILCLIENWMIFLRKTDPNFNDISTIFHFENDDKCQVLFIKFKKISVILEQIRARFLSLAQSKLRLTCLVIGLAQSELTLSKRQKTFPELQWFFELWETPVQHPVLSLLWHAWFTEISHTALVRHKCVISLDQHQLR